jgi:hypothetical protein
MRPRAVLLAASVLAAAALARCAPPQERYLRLDATGAEFPASARPALAGNVQLLPFRARGLLGDRHVVYLDPAAPGEARPSATLVWEDAPPIAVARIAARVLQAAAIAPAVLPPDARGLAAFWLDGSLDRFELVTRPGGPDAAVARIEFTLLAGQSRSPAMIARYCRSEPAGADPAGAFARAITAISVRLAGDLLSHAAALNAAGGEQPGAAILIGQQVMPGTGLCGPG